MCNLILLLYLLYIDDHEKKLLKKQKNKKKCTYISYITLFTDIIYIYIKYRNLP